MAGYREITVASEGRTKRSARPAGRAVAAPRPAGWRGLAKQMLSVGLAEGTVMCRERPGTVLGGVMALVAAGFICVNALSSQKGRHPAPILPKVAAKAPTSAPALPSAAPRDVAKEPVRDSAPKQAAASDPIGDLARAEDTTASVNPRPKPAMPKTVTKAVPEKPAAPKAETPDPAVARAQRALAKLGYGPIKADGAMGPATKTAIEKFERDRKLPVTGEANARTLRALESGAAKG